LEHSSWSFTQNTLVSSNVTSKLFSHASVLVIRAGGRDPCTVNMVKNPARARESERLVHKRPRAAQILGNFSQCVRLVGHLQQAIDEGYRARVTQTKRSGNDYESMLGV